LRRPRTKNFLRTSQAHKTKKFYRAQPGKEMLLTCGKLKSDCLYKTNAQTSTYEFKSPASDDKLKSSSNPVGQGLQNETMLV
jgi:hypothetical protein